MEELKRIKLFAGCSDESLERLLESPCRRQDYPAGRRMLNPGDPCRALMVLVEGQAEARMMGEEGRNHAPMLSECVERSTIVKENSLHNLNEK